MGLMKEKKIPEELMTATTTPAASVASPLVGSCHSGISEQLMPPLRSVSPASSIQILPEYAAMTAPIAAMKQPVAECQDRSRLRSEWRTHRNVMNAPISAGSEVRRPTWNTDRFWPKVWVE